ncbi:MAG: phosphoenolpyruvate carboxykinase (ATP), partial [Legionellales bacterium]|nr:phosphoenolpyruvate carboxykinase (ATP) [Legionellales bacterium]
MINSKINIPISELISVALSSEGAVICDNGALVVKTGKRTGRSPKDRFIVKDEITLSSVAWGKVNQPFCPNKFKSLWQKANSYLSEIGPYESMLQVGADVEFGYNVNVKTEKAWHSIFLRHLFISDNKKNIPQSKTWE